MPDLESNNGFVILEKKIIVKDDPVAQLFHKQGRIEEWKVRKPNGQVVQTRVVFWWDKQENQYE